MNDTQILLSGDHVLTLVVQTNEHGKILNLAEKKQKFKISVGNHDDLPDLRNGAEIDPGYIYTFHITPSLVVSSEQLEDTEPEVRDCQFRHESQNLQLFKVWSRITMFSLHS